MSLLAATIRDMDVRRKISTIGAAAVLLVALGTSGYAFASTASAATPTTPTPTVSAAPTDSGPDLVERAQIAAQQAAAEAAAQAAADAKAAADAAAAQVAADAAAKAAPAPVAGPPAESHVRNLPKGTPVPLLDAASGFYDISACATGTASGTPPVCD